MQDAGLICLVEFSEWVAPVVPVSRFEFIHESSL